MSPTANDEEPTGRLDICLIVGPAGDAVMGAGGISAMGGGEKYIVVEAGGGAAMVCRVAQWSC